MFNPTNTDEVSIQDTQLEASKGKYGLENVSKELPRFKKESKKDNKKEAMVKKYV